MEYNLHLLYRRPMFLEGCRANEEVNKHYPHLILSYFFQHICIPFPLDVYSIQ
jgi:hypothetical protein